MTGEQERTLEALKHAIRMEIDGKEYYLKASQKTSNVLGNRLLQSLAAEEDIHRKVFEGIFNDISNKRGWPRKEFPADGGRALRTVFANAIASMDKDIKSIPGELDAIKKAMEMENETYDFYREQSGKAIYNAEKQFYEALAGQEEEHHRILLDYYEFLKNPAAWFVEKEHPSLDGG